MERQELYRQNSGKLSVSSMSKLQLSPFKMLLLIGHAHCHSSSDGDVQEINAAFMPANTTSIL